MKTIKLSIIGLQMLADNKVAILTKPSSTNPSPNGVHVVSEGQARRIAQRAIGLDSIHALKSLVEVSNGAATLTIQAEECKTGQAWENKKTGETGVYEKDWTKYSNHEIDLGIVAKMKVAELIFNNALNLASQFQAPTIKPVVASTEDSQDAPNV